MRGLLTRINSRGSEVRRYQIDREELGEFLARQVRLVERLPVEADEALLDAYLERADTRARLAAVGRRVSPRVKLVADLPPRANLHAVPGDQPLASASVNSR